MLLSLIGSVADIQFARDAIVLNDAHDSLTLSFLNLLIFDNYSNGERGTKCAHRRYSEELERMKEREASTGIDRHRRDEAKGRWIAFSLY